MTNLRYPLGQLQRNNRKIFANCQGLRDRHKGMFFVSIASLRSRCLIAIDFTCFFIKNNIDDRPPSDRATSASVKLLPITLDLRSKN